MENGKALEFQSLAEVRYLMRGTVAAVEALAGKTSANAILDFRSLASHLPLKEGML